MSDQERPGNALPESLSRHFGGRGKRGSIEVHVHLSSDAEGSPAGETHLVVFQGRLQVFSRKAEGAPFQWVPVAMDSEPRLELEGVRRTLVLKGMGGKVVVLPVSPLEEPAVRELVDTLDAIAADQDDAPTEVWEHGTPVSVASLAPAPGLTGPHRSVGRGAAAGVASMPSASELLRRFELHLGKGDLDAAYCTAEVMDALRRASDQSRAFLEQHRPASRLRIQKVIDDNLWRAHIQHPGQDQDVDIMMAMLAPALMPATASRAKAFGLRRQDARDLEQDLAQVSRVFVEALSVLDVGPADLYLLPAGAPGLVAAHTRERTSFVAGGDLLKGRQAAELAFVAARQVTYLKPKYTLVIAYPDPIKLRAVVLAATRLALPKLPLPKGDRAAVDGVFKVIQKELQPAQKEYLVGIVQRMASRESGVDLDDWFIKSSLSADRAGLVLCQDLSQALKIIGEPGQQGVAPGSDQRNRELCWYALSKEYHAIRRLLGVAVEG